MWKRLTQNLITTLSGIIGAAAAGAAANVMAQGPTKEAVINGAIMGGAAGILGAMGGAAKDPGKGAQNANYPALGEIARRIGGEPPQESERGTDGDPPC